MSEPETPNGNQSGEPAEELQGIVVRVFGRTDVGLVRDHNEDNFLIADLTSSNRSIKPEVRTHQIGSRGSLFVVCDGMGGAAAGEVASRIGVDTIYELMQSHGDPENDEELAQWLDEAIVEAGQRIFTAAKLNRGQRGMGTTVTAAVCRGPLLLLGQVGDSRGYIVRDGEMIQVTKDQSLVQQLIDAKQLTEEEAKSFDKSNIILQALGTAEEVHVDVTSVDLRKGDVLVMCSDGLSGMVEPEQIRDAVLEHQEPMEACRRLTEMACEQGGEDNITVIVARFDGPELLAAAPEDHVEYTKYDPNPVTETTVRTPYPRDPNAPPEAEDDAVATDGAGEKAAAPEPAAEGDSQPATDPAEEAAPPAKEEQVPAAAKPAPAEEPKAAAAPAAEEAAPAKKSKVGVVLGVLAAVIVIGGAAAYFGLGGASGGGEQLPAAQGASPVLPPGAAPSAAAAAPDEPQAPPLMPTDEQQIIGKGGPDASRSEGGRRSGESRGDTAAGDEAATEEDGETGEETVEKPLAPENPYRESEPAAEEKGSPDAKSPSKPTGEKKPKPKKKKKPKKPLIEDNPYD